ncbi:MAG: PH domain-containing protein [Anaerolineales bacterium]|jgi:hypothetical protein
MDRRVVFYPPRRTGTILHILFMVLASGAGIWGIYGVTSVQMAPQLLPYLALIFLFLAALPYLIYRLYGLQRSSYTLERGGVSLRWGWRSERLPMDQIKWVHRVEDLEIPPQPPALHWPGAVTGVRRFQRGPEVEYLAARLKGLVIIAAGSRYFAISPSYPDQFIASYQELIELGTLAPLGAESIRPTLVLSEISHNRQILALILAGGILTISLLLWTLLIIPGRATISLGFDPDGLPRAALESVRLILFPVINTTAYLANLILGLFLYRNPENRGLAYILWGGSILIALLFHIGLAIIL